MDISLEKVKTLSLRASILQEASSTGDYKQKFGTYIRALLSRIVYQSQLTAWALYIHYLDLRHLFVELWEFLNLLRIIILTM